MKDNIMNLIYKTATLEDIDIITNLRTEFLRLANNFESSKNMNFISGKVREFYLNSFRENNHKAYLVYDNDKIIAHGDVSFYKVMPTCHNPSGRKAYIMNLFTRPDYRKKGIATKLLDFIINEVKSREIRIVTLEATEMGRPLYEKYGFVKLNDEMEFEIK